MKRGCLLYPLLFLAFLAAWLTFLGRGEPMDLLQRNPAGPLVLAAASTSFVAALRGVVVMRRDEAAIEKARTGLPLADGERGFAFGSIQPSSDAVLTAPFSGRPAVACATGTWSGTAGGLLGDSTQTGEHQLTPGGAEEAAESRRSWCGCLVLVAAARFLLQAFAILRVLLGIPVRGWGVAFPS